MSNENKFNFWNCSTTYSFHVPPEIKELSNKFQYISHGIGYQKNENTGREIHLWMAISWYLFNQCIRQVIYCTPQTTGVLLSAHTVNQCMWSNIIWTLKNCEWAPLCNQSWCMPIITTAWRRCTLELNIGWCFINFICISNTLFVCNYINHMFSNTTRYIWNK